MTIFELTKTIRLAHRLDAVFPFFADPANLQYLTPAWLHFQICSKLPITMCANATIDYRLRLHGIPIKWTSEITVWEPPYKFVDEQRRGPYRLWIHEHTFEEQDGHTLAADRVRYAVWGGKMVQRLLVRSDLERIFTYRHAQLRARFT